MPKTKIKWLAAVAFMSCLALAQGAQAQVIGTVSKLSGQLVAKRIEGARLLALDSQVRQGDTLITGADSYTAVRFVDGAELVLQPDTRLVLARYVYEADKPQQDRVELHLEQGGFKSTDGLLGQRSQGAVRVTTPDGEMNTGAAPARR